ncbi:complement factor B-like isoform X2 [Leuresthes tenuis]|uniref:complement factor B-like isoform X2 n=1 Tax=Leuresthes tenuis TaxID=355514 RepID=UPI003B50C51F
MVSSSRINMEAFVHWSWLAALLCLFWGEVRCDCTEENVQINGGYYTLTKKLDQGSKLVYHCPEGYYPHPHFYRACQPSGTWDPEPAAQQQCKLVQCPNPTVIKNGFVTPHLERYFVSNVTTYACHAGYALRGSSSRTCLPNGKWSGRTPICSHDSGNTCADPGVPPGASRRGDTFGVDDKVKYACSGDLFLVGSSERVCQDSGYWTGTEPACYYKYTHDTALEVSEAFGGAIMDTLTKLQPPDDVQTERIIRISQNGTLNIYIAMDISPSITEDEVNMSSNAVVTLIKKITSFVVSPNYEIVFFSSKIHEVVNIVDFLDGTVTVSSVIDDLEKFQRAGHTGTNLNLVFKTFEERMAFIKQRGGDERFKEHRHVIILFTDGAYNMGGSPAPTVERIKNMVYMNQNDGSRDEFLDIYVFGIGTVLYDDDLQPLTAGTGGHHYFRLKYDTNLHETFDEIIDESKVVGLCGLHRDYELTDDRVSKQKRYPWMAFVFVQGESPKKCLGSLVAPNFVLTAAHCFQFTDLPKDVTVEIEDRPGSRVKKVKKITPHPNYNVKARVDQGVAEFYDFDIALIQLEEAVQISSQTRPICIPCTQETSNALKLSGASTCQQQEELLLKTHRERLSFLTRAAPLVQEKGVFAKLGDSRNSCISKALMAPGITATDPRLAVTDSFLCTGGINGHRDHIACKGDAGGAVFKNYEQRTIQVGLVSWGTQELCSSGGLKDSNEDSRDFHINLFRMVPFLKSILGNDDQDDYAPLKFLSD